MLFTTADFAVFFTTVLALSWIVPAFGTRWKLLILLASYVFYSWWDWRFCGLLAASTALNQVAAEAIARNSSQRRRRLLLTAAVAGGLATLGFFKYAGFFASSLENALGRLGIGAPLPLLQVVLPVGISFFTFQAISYVVDVYRSTTEPASRLDFAVYLAFFPHVVAGPIVRAREFIPQLRRTTDEPRLDGGRALGLIVGGLFKKIVLAGFLATAVVDPVFAAPGAHSRLEVLAGVYGYAVQIWADFSGYTDIAIGCALLLGIRFPANFNAPYTATSLRDFWRRWHMTLSRWLRDYLYVPLGGSRGSRLLTARNLMLTMLLGGLWHGAAWTFVIWGGIHGAFLVAERRLRGRGPDLDPAVARALGRLVTFHVVCLAWIFFRADSPGTAGAVLGRLFTGGGPSPLLTLTVLLAIAAGIGMQYLPSGLMGTAMARFSRMAPALQGAALAAALAGIGVLGPQGVAPFIYYRF
ncbi:MAG TPA: MBOAT family protein [Candidatus Dormibacteraeota bacterium]|nr:MBOAT family protein [Candidatus Dormibacteraeota bacterium]